MKTLFEQLSKDNQNIILIAQKKNPILWANYMRELKNKNSYTLVTVLTASELFWSIYPKKPFDLLLYIKLFEA